MLPNASFIGFTGTPIGLTDKTEFLDQRHVRGPAFKLLEEAQLFCQRHFPLPGKIVPAKLQRVDTPLIPRAPCGKSWSTRSSTATTPSRAARFRSPSSTTAMEVWSAGTFPTGITPEKLSKSHQSVQRNPIIADGFYKTGLIEKWGRGGRSGP
jgi:ATP-dependent DNA helicase RecG